MLNDDRIAPFSSTRNELSGWNLERLFEAVCRLFGVDKRDIARRGRANALSAAKGVICYLGTSELKLMGSDITARLELSRTGVAAAAKRGYRYCEAHSLSLNELLNV